MIVKDEEGGLRRAVDSVKGIVDEVIIGVDENSTDGTLKIAKEIADVCYEYKWTDNFSAARNTYLGKAKGDWILYMDGHEYVSQWQDVDWEKLEKSAEGLRVSLRMETGDTSLVDRIFKSGIKFVNKIHNSPAIKSTIKCPGILIVHDRSAQTTKALKTREAQREEMMIENMIGKKDLKSLNYTARHHSDSKRYKESIKTYKEYFKEVNKLKNLNKDRIAEIRGAKYRLAQTYYKDKQYKKALEVLDEKLKEFLFLKGQMHSMRENHSEVVKVLLEANMMELTGERFRPVAELDYQLWDCLSVSLFHMGQPEMAYHATQRALEYKDDEQVKLNARMFADTFKATKEKGVEYYDRLFRNGFDTSRYQDVYEIILRMLKDVREPNILEIGCGVGSLGKMLIDKGYKYRGFDFSKSAIKHSKKLSKDHFYIGNAYDEKEYKGDYNVAIATEVLEHVDDLRVLKNIKSGVIFIGSVPNYGDISHLRVYKDKEKDIIERFSKYLGIGDTFFSKELGIFVFKGVRL